MLKKVFAGVSGLVSGAIAGIGSALPLPVIGVAAMSGAFPVIAALVVGVWCSVGVWSALQGVNIVRVVGDVVEVIG